MFTDLNRADAWAAGFAFGLIPMFMYAIVAGLVASHLPELTQWWLGGFAIPVYIISSTYSAEVTCKYAIINAKKIYATALLSIPVWLIFGLIIGI